MYPVAGGSKQSPIDIKKTGCHPDIRLTKMRASYAEIRISELSNNGFSWKAQVGSGRSSLRGGPLGDDEYVLEQFHPHWGKVNERGSEHTIDGACYPAELHLVHWNKSKFNSFAEAAAAEGGLAVLGMFLAVGQVHPEMSKICSLLPFISHKGQAITMPDVIQPGTFIPRNGSYYTYAGSLTTPPCYESVTWIVFEQPLQISEAQLDCFRALKSYHPCETCPQDELQGALVENYRPPCPLCDRVVRKFSDKQEEE
ncbi:Carbonic anhydrase 2 [Chionoecetes opilio]|uniref:Carbonic anhydrase n=1 Tax=Chionoecetes opilio TaxID=41210 RepID=A0A8J8WLJ6_CHIOP|nr:Carbonic anhydrase 2 [Chionoecetes opilio]